MPHRTPHYSAPLPSTLLQSTALHRTRLHYTTQYAMDLGMRHRAPLLHRHCARVHAWIIELLSVCSADDDWELAKVIIDLLSTGCNTVSAIVYVYILTSTSRAQSNEVVVIPETESRFEGP